MTTIKDSIAWLYFNPFFGEAKIEADGNLGIAESALNLAFWSAGVGLAAHLMGAKRPLLIGTGVFAALVLGELVFNASGPTTNGATISPTASSGAPVTAATVTDFSEAEGADFAEADGGFTQA